MLPPSSSQTLVLSVNFIFCAVEMAVVKTRNKKSKIGFTGLPVSYKNKDKYFSSDQLSHS
jgi:hypothetical protein